MVEKKNSKGKDGGNQRTGRAGEYYVVAELNRRGAYAVTFTGNMPEIDVMASDATRSRTVHIQVKTKRASNWHISPGEGDKIPRENTFWVFVNLPNNGSPPHYWILSDCRIRAIIKETYAERVKNKPDIVPMHYLREKLIEEWKDRWDILELWGD